MPEAAKKRYTSRDYERLPEGAPYQLIDGELTMTPSPTFEHQDIVWKLGTQLRVFIDSQHLGKMVGAPMDVYLSETEVYQPDLVFISNESKSIIQERVKGVPELIVEVLSPSNAYYDLVHKKQVYESSGVREYWIIDPQEKTIEVYQNHQNEFRLLAKARQTGSVSSEILKGFSVDLQTLFAKSSP